MDASTITLDVRDDIRAGREPFAKIMTAVATIEAGQGLRLIAPFEPVPLYYALKHQGFSHTTRPMATGDWEVIFTRDSEPGTGGPENLTCGAPAIPPLDPIVTLDARGLEPPQPLVKILEALAALPVGAELRAQTDRRPLHLYPQLASRGFSAETEARSDGGFVTRIFKR